MALRDEVNGGQGGLFCLDLHGVSVELGASSGSLLAYCRCLFSRYLTPNCVAPEIRFELELVDSVPAPPPVPAASLAVHQPRGMVCTADQRRLLLEFDGKGTFVIERSPPAITGRVTPTLLAEPHLLDRLLVGSLALLMREFGIFAVHAFAAVYQGQAALLIGQSGSGKTTAGLALVRAGWGFLANDLALLRRVGEEFQILSCPERVQVAADSASFFPELGALVGSTLEKTGFHAEDIYPHAATSRGRLGYLLFPCVSPGQPTSLRRLAVPEALIALLPHSLAIWDRANVSAHFSLLVRVAEQVPAYNLELGADFSRLPCLLASLPAISCQERLAPVAHDLLFKDHDCE